MRSFEDYLLRWNLHHPVRIAETPTSHVYRVQFEGTDAVLKLLTPLGRRDEAAGALALQCYGGRGAVPLLNWDEGAHLLLYADGRFVKDLVCRGDDKGAGLIICDVLEQMHSYAGELPAGLCSMEENFSSLFRVAKKAKDSMQIRAAKIAMRLLETESERILLHGDVHHKNILESSERGWLAIDPKGLIGERAYDLANVFYNPDDMPDLVETRERIEWLCGLFSDYFKIDQKRILEYAFVYGCLSACWAVEDGLNPQRRLRISRLICGILEGSKALTEESQQ